MSRLYLKTIVVTIINQEVDVEDEKFRTTTELEVGKNIEAIFTKCQDRLKSN